jgi:TRAP-type C4-dicarboxylate transport system permease small subunit
VKIVVGTLKVLRVLSMGALLVMMLVTIVDVTMRLVINELVLGSVEIVQLALVASVFLALPETFLRGEHITVDVIDQVVSAGTLRWLRFAATLVTTVFVGLLAWRLIPPALDTLEVGDRTSDLQLSLFWYWLPLVVGGVAAALTMVLVLLRGTSARKDQGP